MLDKALEVGNISKFCYNKLFNLSEMIFDYIEDLDFYKVDSIKNEIDYYNNSIVTSRFLYFNTINLLTKDSYLTWIDSVKQNAIMNILANSINTGTFCLSCENDQDQMRNKLEKIIKSKCGSESVWILGNKVHMQSIFKEIKPTFKQVLEKQNIEFNNNSTVYFYNTKIPNKIYFGLKDQKYTLLLESIDFYKDQTSSIDKLDFKGRIHFNLIKESISKSDYNLDLTEIVKL